MKAFILSAGNLIHTARWVNSLSQAGVDVWLGTQHPVRQTIDPGVDVIEYPHRGTAGYALMATAVRRDVRSIRPDILHAHYASGYGTTGLLVNRHPYLLSVWGSDVYSFPLRSPVHRWLLRRNLHAADVVASTSHCMADQVRTVAPEIGEIPITPFGIEIGPFAAVAPPAPNGDDGLVIGTVKAMEEIYGVDTLINAFAILQRRLANRSHPLADGISLRLVGGGSRMNDLQRLAEHLGVGDRTTFVGAVPHAQVPGELAKLDIFAALSRQESFGVAALEAGAAGRPVVVSDADGLAEVVLDDISGMVVPRDDADAAATALYELLVDPEKRMRLGQAARQHVQANYAWGQCVLKMLSVYEHTVDRYGANETDA